MQNIIVENRPWGRFERFTLNEPVTVKLLYVMAGQRLSLQYHSKRSEFWKIIKGPAGVEINGNEKILDTDQTIEIPKGARHRLRGLNTDIIILEISFGSFDENDIVRIEDDYKRVQSK